MRQLNRNCRLGAHSPLVQYLRHAYDRSAASSAVTTKQVFIQTVLQDDLTAVRRSEYMDPSHRHYQVPLRFHRIPLA